MIIAILTRRPDVYTTKRLMMAAKQRGHEVFLIDTLRCYMNITPHNPSIHYMGQVLPTFDAVIPRIGPSTTFYGTAVVRQLESMGTFCINSSLAINRSRDKLRTLQLLSRKGIGLPITGFADSPGDIDDLIALVGGAPLIIKLLEGTQGVGVVLAETRKAAESVIQAFMGLKQNIIIQEYIKEAEGADIRCIVLGNRIIATMKRQALPGEFRSNLHRGGQATKIKITKAEREVAIQTAKIMGLNFAGVDILRSKRGPLVMEVNSSPGLEGIEKISKIDIADIVIDYIEKNAKPIGPNTRYEG